MVTVNLLPGDHTVEMSLAGYAQFKGVISVSSTGTVFCVSVEGGACGASGLPGMSVSYNVVTTIMKALTGEMCGWITGTGGWDKLVAYDIMTLVKAYTNQEDIGFEVKSSDIMGSIAYYSGNVESGNQLIGCNF